LARAGRILVREGSPTAAVPPVRAYLVFGQAQAHALGRELPAAVMNQAQIVLADEPRQALASGAGKRRLWTALRQLRRTLAVPGGA
jgi:ABC-type lipoprotein export system ATPase subunit